MLTARSAEMDVVVGLEAGADDYLVKPVRLVELHARIRAHLRRSGTGRERGADCGTIGDLVVDTAGRRVTVAGANCTYGPKEFDLLARLAAEPEVAHRRETLMSEVWDENWFGSTKTLDVHVAALRRKIAESAGGRRQGAEDRDRAGPRVPAGARPAGRRPGRAGRQPGPRVRPWRGLPSSPWSCRCRGAGA